MRHRFTSVLEAFSFFYWSTTTDGCEFKYKQPGPSPIHLAKLPSMRQAGQSYLSVHPIWPKSRAADTILKLVSHGFSLSVQAAATKLLLNSVRQIWVQSINKFSISMPWRARSHICTCTHVRTHTDRHTPSQCRWLTLSDGKPRFKPIVVSPVICSLSDVSAQRQKKTKNKKQSWQTAKTSNLFPAVR